MKRRTYLLAVLSITSLATVNLSAQSVTAAMDNAFNEQFDKGLLMGNVLIASHGKVVYQKSFGFRDIANRLPNTAASAFALASISKQFTSVAILQLKEKGKLRLDDRFAAYFPEFPFPAITVRHLLAQTSGLPEYELFDSLIKKEPNRIFTNQDVIPALKVWKPGLYFKPGESWRYSSMNYCLLALLIEKLSGQTLQNYLTKNIFMPAGMHHTYLENLLIKKSNPDRTVNYEYPTYYAPVLVPVDSIPDDHQMIFNLGGFSGQGGLTSTAEDLLQFDNAFFAAKLTNASDLQEALTPIKLTDGSLAKARDAFGDMDSSGYGFGWFIINDTSKGKMVWHDGGRPGITTVHLHNMRNDQTIIVLENSQQDVHTSAAAAYHLLNGEPTQRPQVSLIRIYAQTLIHDGADAAIIKLFGLRRDSSYKMPSDYLWVNLGYQLYQKPEYIPLAIEVMKTACLLFPDDWYVSEFYGAALERAGKNDLAILMYKKSLAENAHADYAQERLTALTEK